MDPIKGICEHAMHAFARAKHAARPGSPLLAAREALGADRFAEVACEALRASLKRELFALLDEAKAEGPGFRLPHLAEHALIATVVADASSAVIEAAKAAEEAA